MRLILPFCCIKEIVDAELNSVSLSLGDKEYENCGSLHQFVCIPQPDFDSLFTVMCVINYICVDRLDLML